MRNYGKPYNTMTGIFAYEPFLCRYHIIENMLLRLLLKYW